MIKLVAKLILVAYATLVGFFGQLAALDSMDLGYSPIFVLITSISALSLAAAILIVALEWDAEILRFWRPLFWLSCFDLVLGTIMDLGHMSSSFWARVFIAFLVVGFLAPAYYISYALAYRSHPNSNNRT
ncbi:hypothetical protein GTP58_03745 [Duganella sp. CY15W]|uniref:hypothetical protein n=1 Tax=Duganella sp. CY15W TaxID=2692172 RepID=UPI001367BDD3|nr:hypothetical protein [Duganella sp. CY15W]MYM27429.1 hypothetical protein [Duganella sp. CY15W]